MDIASDYSHTKYATFAGGCFWCMVGPFQELNGVLDVKSGYTAGHVENPENGTTVKWHPYEL